MSESCIIILSQIYDFQRYSNIFIYTWIKRNLLFADVIVFLLPLKCQSKEFSGNMIKFVYDRIEKGARFENSIDIELKAQNTINTALKMHFF